jgi:hypothetical protein
MSSLDLDRNSANSLDSSNYCNQYRNLHPQVEKQPLEQKTIEPENPTTRLGNGNASGGEGERGNLNVAAHCQKKW